MMDGHRFDTLTRRLATGTSRRTVLRGLIGGLAGALLGARRHQAATAQEPPLGLDLDLDLLVCVGLNPLLAARVCIALNLPHVARAACENGRCVITACDPGWADCDGNAATGCETPLGTPENCAGCGDVCPSGVCQDGTCLLVNGEPCTAGTACVSGSCVDGVCCDAACAGQCEACTVAGSVGTCTPVTGAPVGPRPACAGTGACTGACDGVNGAICAYPGDETVCDTPLCRGGDAVAFACDGTGSCVETVTDCGLYVCRQDACLTTCADHADCIGAAYCAGGVCQGDKPLGQPCAGRDECLSGFCVDGVCCDTACTGPCEACDVTGAVGACSPVNGQACDDGDPCTENDVCQNGACVGTATSCPTCQRCSGGQCVADPTQDGVTCDDGDLCTVNDACQGGVCIGGDLRCGEGCPCPAGEFCFDGRCAPVCDPGDPFRCTIDVACGSCNACYCGSMEGPTFCTTPNPLGCDGFPPVVCERTSDCPPEHVCVATACGLGNPGDSGGRCAPVCRG